MPKFSVKVKIAHSHMVQILANDVVEAQNEAIRAVKKMIARGEVDSSISIESITRADDDCKKHKCCCHG